MANPAWTAVLQPLQEEIDRLMAKGGGAGDVVTTWELQMEAREDHAQGLVLLPVTGTVGGTPVHRLQVQVRRSTGGSGAPPGTRPSALGQAPSPAPLESMEGEGDRSTLRRRLELVFGAPPGFTTGARAEILADLLSEFGRGVLLDELRRDWIKEFDTGADASPSVSRG